MKNPSTNARVTNRWWCAALFALSALGFLMMFLFQPLFDTNFWIAWWIAFPSLLAALWMSSRLLWRSKRWWVKSGAVLVVLIGVALIAPVIFVIYKLQAAGASIHMLTTAENSQLPDSRKIHQLYLELESTRAEDAPPIVYLAGGPGGAGSATLYLSGRYPVFMAMREFGDVIAWDQRGTMPWNDPFLLCPSTWDYPLDVPFELDRMLDHQRPFVESCRQHFQDKGVDLATYTTAQSVEDLDDLRRQLGSEQITLWATSYGTHLALAYMKRYPRRVHRAILHGTEGLDQTLKLPSQVQAALEHTRELAQSDATLNSTPPDMLADLAAVLAEFERGPKEIPLNDDEEGATSVVIGQEDVRLMIALQLRNGSSRSKLPRMIARMQKGDFSRVAGFAANIRRYSRESLMHINMDCASGATEARLQRINTEASQSLLGNIINTGFPEICNLADSPDLGNTFRAPFQTDIPTLFISGTLDGRTPVSNAEEVLTSFTQGEHLIIEGAGHGDELFVSAPEILVAMQQFMRGEVLTVHHIRVAFEFAPIEGD